ncbi:2-phospho-L-lactate guanylyltransferase [Natranaeroarchaeum aerophilus]|uniref:2-phospho-L-lactate guanylyltransferase n=1 Tax=Natranaeroarchaeum aerophilus TaxID=2917711 RepID=A0AAE3FTN2_9EURY|nr:2-phospho-L-lactate guanylyltransferase [Natranaeroarchaeum aerophilus]MCL9814820.1 2-phospho-L-lactate guanylyltransferase [Natranaeroarchaeum aerophilus]
MRVLVPFDASEPKTRLSDVLDRRERAEFAYAMLEDVLSAVRESGEEPELLATAPLADERDVTVPVTVDDRPLSPAINDVLAGADEPVAVVMADLALARPADLHRLFDADGEVVAVPGRGGGTNALVVRHPEFRVDYHGVSFRDHRKVAARIGAAFSVFDSHRLATDIDERSDLVELLLHGAGHAADWLDAAGFRLAETGGRVTVQRTDDSDSERLK